MKCALHNLGCKVNSYETEAMKQLLAGAGYTIVEFGGETADVYIINTCTVTNIADRKSRQMLSRARKENPDAVILAVGCYAQMAEEKIAGDGLADIIIGNNRKGEIVEVLDQYFDGRTNNNVNCNDSNATDKVTDAYNNMGGDEKTRVGEKTCGDGELRVKTIKSITDISKEKEYERLSISENSERVRAFVKIQDGCNQFCTYCIIPFARGRVRSRSEEDIINETVKLAEAGIKEIVVTGIHLSSYGLDFDNVQYNNDNGRHAYRLLSVIEKIAKVPQIERIRLGSMEPGIITPEFVMRLAAIDKLCPHFHLSLQSGCDATLKRMNRRYDTEQYRESVRLLREYFDNPAITTDVIVGFPGETDEEYAMTRKFIEEIKFFELHVFKYSRRKGTIADRMEGQVPDDVKNGRSRELIELDDRLSGEYRKSFIGSTQKVLIEEYETVCGERLAVGHTDRYVKVYVRFQESRDFPLINSTVNVIITGKFGKDSVISKVSLAKK